MKELITTTEAARIAGVGVSSIKRWANQSLIEVVRTPGGHRRIVKSNLMRFLQDAGAPIRNHGSSRDTSLTEASPHAPDSHDSMAHLDHGNKWANYILGRDVYAIQSALLEARGRLGSWFPTADEACLGLREIGHRWVRGETNILDEHVGSDRLNRSLARIAESLPILSVYWHVQNGTRTHLACPSFKSVCARPAGMRSGWVPTHQSNTFAKLCRVMKWAWPPSQLPPPQTTLVIYPITPINWRNVARRRARSSFSVAAERGQRLSTTLIGLTVSRDWAHSYESRNERASSLHRRHASSGKSVTVLERHQQAGGRARSFVMKRIKQHTGENLIPHIIFRRDYNASRGNAYGLANTIRQTAFLKPKMHSKLPGLGQRLLQDAIQT